MKLLIGFFFKALSLIVANLPGPVRRGVGYIIGFLWFDVFRIRRRVAIENLGIAFPDWSEERKTEIARKSLFHMGMNLVEYSSFPFFRKSQLNRYFHFEGREHVEQALQGGKGALLLTLHLGNGDFSTVALSHLGWPVHLISKQFKAVWLNDLWFGMRGKHGTRFISPEKSSFEILRALRRNELVIFVLDQFMGPPIGVRTRFFAKETGTAAGLALMASRTGAPVVPCYTYRLEDGTHQIVFEAPIPYLDNGLRDADIAVMTQIYTDKIESIIRKHPEQWMWIHRRWKEFRD